MSATDTSLNMLTFCSWLGEGQPENLSSLGKVSLLQIVVIWRVMFAFQDWSISKAVSNQITIGGKRWQRPSRVTLFYNTANTEYYKEMQFSISAHTRASVVQRIEVELILCVVELHNAIHMFVQLQII